MNTITSFLKSVNVVLFKRKHSFITYYSENRITTFKDEYTQEYFPSNETISSFIQAFVKTTCVSCSSRNDVAIDIYGSENDMDIRLDHPGYLLRLKYSHKNEGKCYYKGTFYGSDFYIEICKFFMRKYYFFGSPKFIYFNIYIR